MPAKQHAGAARAENSPDPGWSARRRIEPHWGPANLPLAHQVVARISRINPRLVAYSASFDRVRPGTNMLRSQGCCHGVVRFAPEWSRANLEGQQIDSSVNAQAVRLQDGLRRLTLAIVEGLQQQLSPYQIDAVEYTILGVCLAAGPITIKDLQSKVPIDYTQISRTTSRLEDKGLMAKAHLADDRRVVRVEVTEKGRELMPELMQSALRFYKGLVGDISQAELAACTAVMQKLSTPGEAAESGGTR